ncbi:hypothetical protein ACFS27_13445 [Promicromonospora vindobonensis]|uniref:Lipoprotein antigen n=1 Tax=Promicromonospora vindobonensis TaxID=195748 RepID=A0ABW5VVI8_9MICO
MHLIAGPAILVEKPGTGVEMRHIFVSRVGGPVGKAKTVAAGAALAGAAILLSACGSGASGADGEYLSTKNDDLLSLVVEGSSVTYTEIHCDGDLDDAERSVGELNEGQTAIAWTEPGRFENSSEVTITENAIDISGWETFAREGSDAGNAVRADHEEGCAGTGDAGSGSATDGSTSIEDGTYVGARPSTRLPNWPSVARRSRSVSPPVRKS